MANSEDKQLSIDVIARIDKLEKSMAKASAVTSKATAEMTKASATATTAIEANMAKIGELAGEKAALGVEKLGDQFKELGKSVLLPLAALGTLDGAIEAIKAQIERADTAGKLSESLGLSVESLTQLQHAAEMADVSSDQLSIGLKTLATNALKVAEGTKGGPALAFETLGISVKNAAGQLKPTNVLFDQTAQKLSTMANSATKTALAQQIFGKSGSALIPLLNEGAAGLKEMADESDRLGLTVSGSAAKGAAELSDQIKLLNDRLQGIVSTVVQDTIPAIEGAVSSISGLMDSAQGSGAAISLLEGGVRDVSAFVVQMSGGIQELTDDVIGLQDAFTVLTTGKGGMWSVEAWFKKGLDDAAAADAKAKAILDGTYKPPAGDNKPAATGSGSGGGGIASTGGNAQSDKVASVTAALQRQIDALSQTAKQQAESNALARAGITLDDSRAAGIVSLADRLYDQREAQKTVNDAVRDFQDTEKSALSTFISDLEDGKTAVEALGDAIGDVANKLIDAGLNGLIGGQTSGLTGLFSSLLNIGGGGGQTFSSPMAWAGLPGHANGIANTGGVRGQVAGIVHGQEAVIPLPNGGKVPVSLSMPRAANDNGAVHVSIPISINAAGADPAAVARLGQVVAQMKSDLPATVIGAVRKAKKSRQL